MFFKKSLKERQEIVKKRYSFENSKEMLDSYNDMVLASQFSGPTFFWDIFEQVLDNLPVKHVHQIGFFSGMESKFLIKKKYGGEISGSDFDARRIKYLKSQFSNSEYAKIALSVIDLESQNYCFPANTDTIVGGAVLNNIQPESIEYFFRQCRNNAIKVILLNEIYYIDSLCLDQDLSLPDKQSQVWYHNYIKLSKRFGFDCIFIPSFGKKSHAHQRGEFIIYRKNLHKKIERCICIAMKNFISKKRQNNFQQYLKERLTKADLEDT